MGTFLDSMKPWPLVQKLTYGPTAGLFFFFLILGLSACMCAFVLTCFLVLLSVFPHCQQLSVFLHLLVCSFASGPAAGVWVNLDQIQHACMPCPSNIHLILSLTPSFSHSLSLNSSALSGSTPQQWPGASRDQHGHTPLLTATLCLAACLAGIVQGVAKQLDNNFCQWIGERIRMTRREHPGLVLLFISVLC